MEDGCNTPILANGVTSFTTKWWLREMVLSLKDNILIVLGFK